MIIFSVYQSKQDEGTNLNQHLRVAECMYDLDIPYAQLEGVWQGVKELSFITPDNQFGRDLAFAYDQDAYLERGHYGFWYLIETETGKILDTFKTIKEVAEKDLGKYEGYTRVGGKYFVASHI